MIKKIQTKGGVEVRMIMPLVHGKEWSTEVEVDITWHEYLKKKDLHCMLKMLDSWTPFLDFTSKNTPCPPTCETSAAEENSHREILQLLESQQFQVTGQSEPPIELTPLRPTVWKSDNLDSLLKTEVLTVNLWHWKWKNQGLFGNGAKPSSLRLLVYLNGLKRDLHWGTVGVLTHGRLSVSSFLCLHRPVG